MTAREILDQIKRPRSSSEPMLSVVFDALRALDAEREAMDECVQGTLRTVAADAGDLLTRVRHIEQQVPCAECTAPTIADCREHGARCGSVPSETIEALHRSVAALRAERDRVAQLVLDFRDKPEGAKFDALVTAAESALAPF